MKGIYKRYNERIMSLSKITIKYYKDVEEEFVQRGRENQRADYFEHLMTYTDFNICVHQSHG